MHPEMVWQIFLQDLRLSIPPDSLLTLKIRHKNKIKIRIAPKAEHSDFIKYFG